ncbi:hypothetical protein LSTR_LSTR005586 [Laodelphax striatellus]|uniref:Peptidase S1 domain-containing protein n=1 Tax=Laodelphax striatellus TaxID=195883 RepID=A0A482WXH9_LAOST|nr:hypothetical protein LSTR_LSTR005586 [Laodelphax striatellus]
MFLRSFLCSAILLSIGSSVKAAKRPPLPSSNVQLHHNDTQHPQLTTIVTLEIDTQTNESHLTVHNITAEEPESLEILPPKKPNGNSCRCVCGVSSRTMRIVGGNETKINEFPWIAMLSYKGKFYCAGALITRQHLLTAAHCVEGLKHKEMSVLLGEHDRRLRNETELTKRKVAKVMAHPNFTISNFNNDIAILKLDAPVNIQDSNLRTACLPQDKSADYTSRIGVVAGWGRLNEKKPTANVLNKVSVPIMSTEQCLKSGYSKSRLTNNMLCAGYLEGKLDACQGDSGGPLHLNSSNSAHMEVAGIVSWGRGCARPNYPGVYTRVVNYKDWIKDQLDGECTCAPPQIHF